MVLPMQGISVLPEYPGSCFANWGCAYTVFIPDAACQVHPVQHSAIGADQPEILNRVAITP